MHSVSHQLTRHGACNAACLSMHMHSHPHEPSTPAGFSFDWDREFSTTDPQYYKWTQWIFLQLFHRGLAYQAEVPVNWCPELGTVLANEEVIDGRSERGSYPVERLPMKQVCGCPKHRPLWIYNFRVTWGVWCFAPRFASVEMRSLLWSRLHVNCQSMHLTCSAEDSMPC